MGTLFLDTIKNGPIMTHHAMYGHFRKSSPSPVIFASRVIIHPWPRCRNVYWTLLVCQFAYCGPNISYMKCHVYIHCIQFVFLRFAKTLLLQKWSVHCAVSLYSMYSTELVCNSKIKSSSNFAADSFNAPFPLDL